LKPAKRLQYNNRAGCAPWKPNHEYAQSFTGKTSFSVLGCTGKTSFLVMQRASYVVFGIVPLPGLIGLWAGAMNLFKGACFVPEKRS
jgi:hypothetical protein